MNQAQSKRVVVGADFAGFALKEHVKRHLDSIGWNVHDLTPIQDEAPMYHRVGFMVGAQISERRFGKALAFCGSGMGIHVAASKCPHVHAAVAESVSTARRAAAANGCNVLAMGGFWTAPRLGAAMAEAFLETELGQGYEDWPGFYEYHRLGFDECELFDYEAYKANGFNIVDPGTAELGPEPKGLAF